VVWTAAIRQLPRPLLCSQLKTAENQSFQTQELETADVSRTHETIASSNYPSPQASLRNGIEEADGSIPFSSTKFLGFIFLKGGLKRFGLESFQGEEANLLPSSTVSTRRWRAPAIASTSMPAGTARVSWPPCSSARRSGERFRCMATGSSCASVSIWPPSMASRSPIPTFRSRSRPSDADVAVRMVVTGHSRERISKAILDGARADRPNEDRDWQAYVRRVVQHAFRPPGEQARLRLEPLRAKLLRTEGRQDERELLRRLGSPSRGV
jgi:hypothetical protein